MQRHILVNNLESAAIRHCFVSRFDYRVFQYTSSIMMMMMTAATTASGISSNTADINATSSTTMSFCRHRHGKMVDSWLCGGCCFF